MNELAIDTLPLSSVLFVTVAVVLLAIEIGFRMGRWRRDQGAGLAESEAQLSAMTGAHLALLAFIMAFSFRGRERGGEDSRKEGRRGDKE